MNYTEFHENAKRRLTEALLSMWAAGKKDTQGYLKHIFEEEPILAEPVFQSMFPWKSDTRKFEEFTDVLDGSFITALSGIEDKKYCFPKERKPYIHQSKSWKQLLTDKKSIVVTSGTGSGKTECFMLPIIQDLMQQQSGKYGKDNSGGIQAIFLYPLNALMSSQQKRMSAWCKAVNPNVTFAMYKGDTKENSSAADDRANFPELVSRKRIRETPPQILFTNPTMLEYMLVRKQDKPILDISKAKKSLRWIVLDEAHTYSGSSAAELAMQIRRIMDAFGVTVNDVRFAATSATLGSGDDREYKDFLSRVTGKKQDEIVVIHGEQIIPDIERTKLDEIVSQINNGFEQSGKTFHLTSDKVLELRKKLCKETLSATEIAQRFSSDKNIPIPIGDSLQLIDKLSEKNEQLISGIDRRGALLPTRAHFFVRNMGGLYACVNPECSRHKDIRIDLGALTTIAQTECSECHSKLIEVNRCNSCGNFLLTGKENNGVYGFAEQKQQGLVEIDSNDDETEDENILLDEVVSFVLAKGVTEKPISNSNLVPWKINTQEGKIQSGKSDFVACYNKYNVIVCPHCGGRTDKLQSLYTGNLFSRLLASTLLEQAEPEPEQDLNENSLWEGRKYISFTDNRQGTAKSTFQLNIEVERNWIRTAIYHYLSNERRIVTGQDNPQNPSKTFTEFANTVIGNSELKKLFAHLPYSFRTEKDEMDYLKQLIIDQFGRRPKRAGINNPETMGLVRIVYPKINEEAIPDAIRQIFRELHWEEQDWRDFLKIAIDYFIRESWAIVVPPNYRKLRTQVFVNSPIYPSNSGQAKKWPTLNLNRDGSIRNPNRLIVLLLLAMGIRRENEITKQHQCYIEKILSSAWTFFLRTNILEPDAEREPGYRLNLLGDRVAYQIIEEAYICPVNQTPLDTIFRGYSPMVTSRISSNLEKYKITEPPLKSLKYPYFPYAYNRDNNHAPIDNNAIIDWENKNLEEIRAAGLWSNLHERILLNSPIYLAAEHTAQQDKETLRRIEEKFERHQLNILSCSTTMEMGVDISGISEVAMNNVPPKPANYLQRAGRAGRGSETKALALTFCAPGPIGSNIFNNQKWAMTHKTAIPIVSFDSNTLIQRHINSFLLSSYIATVGENNLTVSSTVKNFFYPENDGINHYTAFIEYLNKLQLNDDNPLLESYNRLVKETCKQNILFADSVSACKSTLESIFKLLNERTGMLETKKEQLLEANYNQISPAITAIEAQLRHIKRQNILGFFAEHNFIPSAGIPTGIVEFDTYNVVDYRNNNNNNADEANEYHFGYQKVKPSLLLTQAISEYAPGNQIVLNETCYVSRGIVFNSQWNDARRVIFQCCRACGYSILKEGDRIERCPHCIDSKLQGGIRSQQFTPLIEPAGYTVDFHEEPTRTINDYNKKSYAQPELLNMPIWDTNENSSPVKMELRFNSQESEILYYNKGNGYGYAVCIECGRAVPDVNIDNNYEDTLRRLELFDHTPIRGGRNENRGRGRGRGRGRDREHCDNDKIKRQVLLGGRFQTDFVEIRFRKEDGRLMSDEDTIYSLGVILTQKLAEKIGINPQELSFGVKRYRNYSSIFIFDTAKGGAGYSIRFYELKDDVIDLAQKALSGCECEKACDKCLINRDSQWSLERLDRKKALEWLDLEIKSRNNVPDNIKCLFSKVYALTADFDTEIQKVLTNPDLQSITFFVNNDIETWEPDKWKYFEKAKKLRIGGINVRLAFENLNIEPKKLSASQFTMLGEICLKFKTQTHSTVDSIDSLLIAEFSGDRKVHYFSVKGEITKEMSSSWAKGTAAIYRSDIEQHQFKEFPLDFLFSTRTDNQIMFDIKIKDRYATTQSLPKLMYSQKTEEWDTIFDKIRDKSVSISYVDTYMKSPLSCRILVDTIRWVVEKANLTIRNFKLDLATIRCSDGNDFESSEKRNEYVSSYASHSLKIEPKIEEKYLPHWRELKFKNEDFEFIIRPDGGFENGWKVDWGWENNNPDWEDLYDKNVKLYNATSTPNISEQGVLYTVVYKKNDK